MKEIDPKDSPVKNELYNKLPSDKIKINWNKKPIKMSLFLSFLTVDVVISRKHLGHDTGWTLRTNDDLKLKIRGGIVRGIDLLDSIEYGKNLSNPYNNFVNPFYLFDIMNDEGKDFFASYYKDEIDMVLDEKRQRIDWLTSEADRENGILEDLEREEKYLFNHPTH